MAKNNEDDFYTKLAQIMTNFDLYGPLSNPMTHFHDYPSIDAARKARIKVRKKILERILSSNPDKFDGKDLKKHFTYKTREDL